MIGIGSLYIVSETSDALHHRTTKVPTSPEISDDPISACTQKHVARDKRGVLWRQNQRGLSPFDEYS